MSGEAVLTLASQSPGRAAVLTQAGIRFRQIVSDVDEDAATAAAGPVSPGELALVLARAKAEAVAALPEAAGSLVLGCDSVFEVDGAPFGKPYTRERAAERLRAQSGRTGVLHSGLWVCDRRSPSSGVPDGGTTTSTGVTFAPLSEDEIQAYVATEEPLHCAGSFTIDGRGAALVERLDGDPSAVVGISVQVLRVLLRQRGVPLSDLWGP
ncbi:nucleoside triphosphate pyrophosphatase [Falsarthrobacter nasiphocae]|uniref:Nucleoside triphosphate pyrophosphatase n=1 Tax=Falsarthrobacter nasiphocae TaxID=189863 RepID=A0AAE4C8N2_9MICC|nr:nucleoside triphosphate pyrophosphatase [Falsarthrobacter nasiphocae]MDR6892585.1 septum formation protein [Falsarthrobacter nasiphocae]